MKKVLILLWILLPVLLSCQPSTPEDDVQRGDLLFVALPYDYHAADEAEATAIRASVAALRQPGCPLTDTLNFIHVAILDVVDDSVFVIDASLKRGVQRYPWADFVHGYTLRDGSLPTFIVARLNDPTEADRYIANACRFIGQPYDVAFAPDNGAMYCSELVRESYVTAAGDTLFEQYPIDVRAPYGDIAPYWRGMFGKLGKTPEDMGIGTWPNTMIHTSCLHLVDALLPYVEPAVRESFVQQKDTLVRGLGPQLHSRVTPRDITVLDAYYYSFETSDGTQEDNAVYTFLNHDTSDPAYYGLFAEDSLARVFASERHYRTPVDGDVERGVVEPTIADMTGYWVFVHPFNNTFVFDNHWDFIPALYIQPKRVDFLTMDGVWMQNIMAFQRNEDASFDLRLDGTSPHAFGGHFECVDSLLRVYRMADAETPRYIAPAVKAGQTSFEVVEYACRIPELLDSYFSEQ